MTYGRSYRWKKDYYCAPYRVIGHYWKFFPSVSFSLLFLNSIKNNDRCNCFRKKMYSLSPSLLYRFFFKKVVSCSLSSTYSRAPFVGVGVSAQIFFRTLKNIRFSCVIFCPLLPEIFESELVRETACFDYRCPNPYIA